LKTSIIEFTLKTMLIFINNEFYLLRSDHRLVSPRSCTSQCPYKLVACNRTLVENWITDKCAGKAGMYKGIIFELNSIYHFNYNIFIKKQHIVYETTKKSTHWESIIPTLENFIFVWRTFRDEFGVVGFVPSIDTGGCIWTFISRQVYLLFVKKKA